MIWTPEELGSMHGAHMWRSYDELFLTRVVQGNPEDFVKQDMLREFSHACSAKFLVVDQADIHIVSRPGPRSIEVRVDWNPGERPVEFVGGPSHGNTYGPLEPRDYPTIHTPGSLGSRALMYAPPGEFPTSTLPNATYKLWGWNPTTRAWVFLYEGTN